MKKPLTFPFFFQVVLFGFLLFSLWGHSFPVSFQVALLCFLFFFLGIHAANLFLEGEGLLDGIRSGEAERSSSSSSLKEALSYA